MCADDDAAWMEEVLERTSLGEEFRIRHHLQTVRGEDVGRGVAGPYRHSALVDDDGGWTSHVSAYLAERSPEIAVIEVAGLRDGCRHANEDELGIRESDLVTRGEGEPATP